jgi:WD40 repeat protein
MDKLELFYFNIAMHDAIKVPYNNIFENVFDLGSHKGAVIRTQVSSNRNIIVSLGDDKVIKFWDFNGVEIHGLFQYQFLE